MIRFAFAGLVTASVLCACVDSNLSAPDDGPWVDDGAPPDPTDDPTEPTGSPPEFGALQVMPAQILTGYDTEVVLRVHLGGTATVRSVVVTSDPPLPAGAVTLYDDGVGSDLDADDGTWSGEVSLDAFENRAQQAVYVLTVEADTSAGAVTGSAGTLVATADPNAHLVAGNMVVGPRDVLWGQVNRIEVGVVAAGANGAAVEGVSLDLSALGGPPEHAMSPGATSRWTTSWEVAATMPPGVYSLAATIRGTEGLELVQTRLVSILTSPSIGLTAGTGNPTSVDAGEEADVRFTVHARGRITPVDDVTIDLTALGGHTATPMNDDGFDGDLVAGDGIWSLSHAVSRSAPVGKRHLRVAAEGWQDGVRYGAELVAPFEVVAAPRILVDVATVTPAEVRQGGVSSVDFVVRARGESGAVLEAASLDTTPLGGPGNSLLTRIDDDRWAMSWSIPASLPAGTYALRVTVTGRVGEAWIAPGHATVDLVVRD